MKFVDLFAGLGGFHLAMSRLGHECVFASEIDPTLQTLYEINFGMIPAGDIMDVSVDNLPGFDILCAGFPCQSFSKAGFQRGLNDPRGKLLDRVVEIVDARRPRYVLLENVANFKEHNGGATWAGLRERLRSLEYDTELALLSPHEFDVPHNRRRAFIVAARDGLDDFTWPARSQSSTSLRSVLEENPDDAKPVSETVARAIEIWEEFLGIIPAAAKLPSFPIWSMEFGADYPFETSTPLAVGAEHLAGKHGAFGSLLTFDPTTASLSNLPSYARSEELHFPKWKKNFIRSNRQFFAEHELALVDWLPKVQTLPRSFQKLEWNAQGAVRTLSDKILQVRASGLRAKRADTAPSLVAMTTSQVPIVTWESRYMTPSECARLQGMSSLHLPVGNKAYEALGNAVNADLVSLVGSALLHSSGRSSTQRQLKWSTTLLTGICGTVCSVDDSRRLLTGE